MPIKEPGYAMTILGDQHFALLKLCMFSKACLRECESGSSQCSLASDLLTPEVTAPAGQAYLCTKIAASY